MGRWTNLNKVRIHNRNESMKHFIVKAMVVKVLFNEGYEVYSEHDIKKRHTDKIRVADIAAYDSSNINKLEIVIEVETKLTKKHERDLLKFHEDHTIYIIELKRISNDIKKMEKQIRHILGM